MLVRIAGRFALDLVARAAGAHGTLGVLAPSGIGVAALHHEILDDPMESRAIVIAAVGELLEVSHGAGGILVVQLCDQRALGRDDSCLLHCRVWESRLMSPRPCVDRKSSPRKAEGGWRRGDKLHDRSHPA